MRNVTVWDNGGSPYCQPGDGSHRNRYIFKVPLQEITWLWVQATVCGLQVHCYICIFWVVGQCQIHLWRSRSESLDVAEDIRVMRSVLVQALSIIQAKISSEIGVSFKLQLMLFFISMLDTHKDLKSLSKLLVTVIATFFINYWRNNEFASLAAL